MVKKGLFCCALLYFSYFAVNVFAIETCDTPRRKPGTCIKITECAPLFSILQNQPIGAGDADFLRKSQCGFEGTLPKVCCPIEPEKPIRQPPPSVPFQPESATSGGSTSPALNSDLLPKRTQCGVDTQNRIYGGEKTDLDEFPWMALVEYERANKARGFYCGGVLINSKYILTAAHCVKGKDLPSTWKLVGVRLGEYNTDTEEDCIDYKVGNYKQCAPPPQNVAVVEQIAHESYDPYDINQYHDIALLRLVRDVQYTDFVRPICLPTTTNDLTKQYTGTNVFVAGWGKTENRSESNIKLKLKVPVKSNDVCVNTYRAANVQLDNKAQICAGGEKGKDSCRGDSGGPLMSLNADAEGNINWISIGVVSFGPSPCGMENWPGVYTNVANYVPWIISKLRP